jgi:hypothetical protein
VKKICIALIHLGEEPAPYLLSNIKELILRFPNHQIALIYSSDEILPKSEIPKLILFKYIPRESEQKALRNQEIEFRFRSGYWRFTLERLLSIQQFHSENRDLAILHIESDVLLLPSFPFNKLLDVNSLMWCPCDNERDIASLLYTPEYSESLWLAENVLNQLKDKKFITDMQVLHNIARAFPSRVKYFPSLIDLISPQSSKEFDSSDLFDGAIVGQWLTGLDPRNNWGFTDIRATDKLKTDENQLLPWYGLFTYSREIGLQYTNNGRNFSIHNLHIHSKNSNLLGERWEQELARLVNTQGPTKEFSVFTLLQLLAQNRRKGTLFRFILGHPIFRHVLVVLKAILRRIARYYE